MPLPIDVYLGASRREGDALAVAAEGRLDASVPSCPGWVVADLVWHAGKVHHFWAAVAEGAQGREVVRPSRPANAEVVAWYRAELDRLERVLTDADPAAPCSTWAGRRDVAWIQRRMAHETAVHRWDAEAAVGSPGPIEPVLAVDGVDEFLELFAPRSSGLSGTVHLHGTDADGEWLIRLEGDGLEVERGHAKGDAAVRATASDLLLLLWRRRHLGEGFEVFGDRGLAGAFVAAAELG